MKIEKQQKGLRIVCFVERKHCIRHHTCIRTVLQIEQNMLGRRLFLSNME